jgi:hypothetical protein
VFPSDLVWDCFCSLGLVHKNTQDGPLGNQTQRHSFHCHLPPVEDEDDEQEPGEQEDLDELFQVQLVSVGDTKDGNDDDDAPFAAKALKFSFYLPYNSQPLVALNAMVYAVEYCRKRFEQASSKTPCIVHIDEAFSAAKSLKSPQLPFMFDPSAKLLKNYQRLQSYLWQCTEQLFSLRLFYGTQDLMDLF